MRRSSLLVVGIVVAILLLFGIVLSVRAPASTNAELTPEPESTAETTDTPATLPGISGDNLDGVTLSFPGDFAADVNLVVMPFDRDQQTSAINWLPTFEALAERYPNVDYYSIAALENLSPMIRTLVIGGLNLGVTDPATRTRTVVLFLDNQQAFVDALGIPDREMLRVLVFARDGRLLYENAGTFSETAGFQFQSVVDNLIAGS